MRHQVFKGIILFLILTGLFVLTGCLEEKPVQPRAVSGVIDLQQYPMQNSRARLDGEWQFFPHAQVDHLQNAESTLIDVPGSWNQHISQQPFFSSHGFGVYRLVILTDETQELGLKLPRIFTAYTLYINGERLISAGQTGQSRDQTRPAFLTQTAHFTAQPGENELLIQVSNYHHRSGGILESIDIGAASLIDRARTNAIAFDLFVFGSLFMIGIYHLALYVFRRKYRPPLYFGLFCLLIAIRTLLVSERFFHYLFTGFSWELAHKLQTVTYYLGMPVILLFCYYFFKGWFSRSVVKIICLGSMPFILMVLLTPARIFTVINPVYQIFSAVAMAYIAFSLIRVLLKDQNQQELPVIIIGAFIVILTSLNDILYASIWFNDHPSAVLRTIIRSGNLSSAGQIIFVMTFALVMARRISDSFNNEEIVTAKLKQINRNLDKIVAARTRALENTSEKVEQQKNALEDANQKLQALSLKDPLTGLWNRRQYDHVITQEWGRALRRQTALSLIVIDIDNFKAYNDHLGHAQGDLCLIKLAALLKEGFQRAGELSARYGGEEFVVILPGLTADQAYVEADRLCRKVEALAIPHPDSPVSQYVTVSVGVAGLIPDRNMNPGQLFELADQAMYQAKDNGRNQTWPCRTA